MTTEIQMDQQIVNVVKGLIMDGVRKANSGHPGGAMSSTDFASVLYSEFLNFDPDNTNWFNRDRFVLAAGHESMLLYSLLHLCGFISIEDLKQFRQLGSITPGHPEHEVTPGVEATSGPLGQGTAMSVGFAVAEAYLSEKLGSDICDHYTYALASDGDFQEPVSLGAATLAGLWGLGKLVVYYDSNDIQLAGPTAECDCTDYKKIFEGFCWQVIEVNGHDRDAIRQAIKDAQAETSKPTIIIGKTVMACGAATVEGDHNTHGAPFSPEEIAATKEKLGLPAEDFYVPAEVQEGFQSRFDSMRADAKAWNEKLEAKLSSDAEFKALWETVNADRSAMELNWPEFTPGETMATRKAWGACLNGIMDSMPTLIGGSADLDPSNQTLKFRQEKGNFGSSNRSGQNLAFGVREFPMAAICNGIALHGGLIPFGATFLTFSDYCRNAMRMSALQKLPVLYVYTHDSFYVGEDGPTHQPIEHVASLRLIPDLVDLRPADAQETALCLDIAFRQTERPATIFLTRQGLPTLDLKEHPQMVEGVKRGGYVLQDCEGTPELILIGSGSEVSLAMEAAKIHADKKIRVVSMPSMTLFEEQPQSYKDEVLPPAVTARAAVEAGRSGLWYKYVGLDGIVLGLDHFGASAPAGQLAEKYGFTPELFANMLKEKFFG
ncbi:MAG: transketolase [Desulfovibrio sp.]